ncbi:hypothetical protein D3C77_808100 [compost metagenome]
MRICMARKRLRHFGRFSAVIPCLAALLASTRDMAWKLSAMSDQMISPMSPVIYKPMIEANTMKSGMTIAP